MAKIVEWECAVCGSAMAEKGKCASCQPPEDFQGQDFWAFASLLLHMYKLSTGRDSISITLEQLKKFPIKDVPDVLWDPVDKAWVMRNKRIDTSPIIVAAHKLFERN